MTNGYGHNDAGEQEKQESTNRKTPVANEKRTSETENKPDASTKK